MSFKKIEDWTELGENHHIRDLIVNEDLRIRQEISPIEDNTLCLQEYEIFLEKKWYKLRAEETKYPFPLADYWLEEWSAYLYIKGVIANGRLRSTNS